MQPKRRFGQNFLNNPAVLKIIGDEVKKSGCATVVEIGGGTGILTEMLVALEGVDVYVIELDRDMIPGLVKIAGRDRVIEGNVLDIPLDLSHNIFVAGNLPYYITKPIINRIVQYRKNIDEAVIMVQKEVGENLTTSPGTVNYNGFTVYVQTMFDVHYLRTVRRGSFFPPPNVDSALVSLKTKTGLPGLFDKKETVDIIFESFRERRKTLNNNLRRVFSRETVAACLDELHISERTRAQDVSVEKFSELLRYLSARRRADDVLDT